MSSYDRRKFLKTLALGSLAAVFGASAAMGQGHPGMGYYDPAAAEEAARFAQVSETLPTAFVHPTLASNSTDDVAVRLICYFDISGSIDNQEHQFQLEAMARAIESEDFKRAVFANGGPGSIAISVADFDDSAELRIPWLDIRDPEADDYKFAALANEIRGLQRRASGMTSQSRALVHSMTLFDNSPWGANKSIVDILTDGTINTAHNLLPEARDRLTREYEATINVLVTETTNDSNTRQWAEENLRTLPGHVRRDGTMLEPGFVKVVATQRTNSGGLSEYNRAMEAAFKRKLILEVAGIDIGDEAQQELQQGVGLMRRILRL